mmetsp:Transcript_2407/g.4053  ORF Transcript_2407/g.4053 Transcript_2407/m.4053 type:complete len:179 (+) Transcript_2407:350-886(+)
MHVPSITFLLQDFVAQAPKEKKERKRKDRTVTEPVQTASTVTVEQLQEQAEDKAQVARMQKLQRVITQQCEAHGKVNMFHLLLHPTSFSQTVENFFDLSFLVKDGKAKIDSTRDGVYVYTAKPPEAEEYEKGLLKQQNILKLDYPMYVKLVDRWLSHDEPLLKSRDDHKSSQPAKKQK